jgi:transcriptional regulator with XRE-family HTH domain
VGIGGALAEARTEAGLTVTQVSERTRIREKLIRDIERDDYSACGGDYYARGHIRAIARVVGTDPVPLIEEYDAAHMPPEPDEADRTDTHGWRIPGLHRLAYTDAGGNGLAGSSSPVHGVNGSTHAGNGLARNSVTRNHYGSTGVPADARPDTSADADTGTELYDAGTLASGGTGAGRGAGVLDSAARWAESARSRLARPPEPVGSGVPGGITAAEAFRPSMPLEPRRRRRGTRALALIVLAAIGTLVYLLAVGGLSPAPQNTATHHPAGSTSAKHPSGKSTTNATAPAAAAGPLAVVSATAFGPGGVAHGDNPQEASFVLNDSDNVGWQTDWYGTPDFAGMQSGTGLLLDMGRPVTVTSARIRLGPASGGAIELRAGNTPSLRHLQVVAQATNPGGTLSVPISSPVTARYLLIWFTSLPPDSTGTYQATIYHVRLLGTS